MEVKYYNTGINNQNIQLGGKEMHRSKDERTPFVFPRHQVQVVDLNWGEIILERWKQLTPHSDSHG
jgi:hypothetical protein